MALKLGPYSAQRWKYLQWACEAILMWNQWNLFEKVTEVQKLAPMSIKSKKGVNPEETF